MDDFLHNLRQGRKKAQTRSQGRYYKTRTKVHSYPANDLASTSGNVIGEQMEHIKGISESLESMAENQHLQVTLDERMVVAQENQAQALEVLSGSLTQLVDSVSAMITSLTESFSGAMHQERTLEPYAIPPNIDELIALSREESKTMIRELRDRGLSFEKIAKELNDRKIKTITGRGLWQAQTVYRLFKE